MAGRPQNSGFEASAITVLKRAVELDGKGRFTESLVCYQEGLNLLMEVLKVTTDDVKKQAFRTRIREYMDRAEKVKQHVEQEKEAGKYHEQIHIVADSTNNSYSRILGPFLDEFTTEVHVEDPYIRSAHQIYNFLRLCELLVGGKTKVKRISLTTGRDEQGNAQTQQGRLDELKRSLSDYGVTLDVNYSSTLHDREIRLNNGWIIKIGRGLDYFKNTGKFSIGFCDMDLRKCQETTVDIFHSKHTAQNR
ncbi:MIT domain-containing protein 1-like isoform X1 [Asterias rubens]|uniref:MIT domain-containing protein 1-like isoform X1 n=1 Tax=Asterias rubens TaxID=7604 RepID=UPI0014551B64|nr:MIT domain-containing protein 1-like isoform X1 [Asterias rubens]XP_033646314.1 MIT domain-containing protein 1-like isoform X1 [Asterias rubens]XP_033646315.1 MIT domain-containing protein 1-like isoform X1 [Asterias rubens]